MFTVKIPREFLATFGSSCLTGLCFQKGFDFKDDLRIEFEQSSIEYRQAHGPDEIIIPEFVPMCLAEDLLSLAKRGFKIKIGEYTKVD
jgi:hypothetical protein